MQYRLRVTQLGQPPKQIELEALDSREAKAQAQQQGYTVLGLSEARRFHLSSSEQFPVILFCQEFKVLIEAGLTMSEALEVIAEHQKGAAKMALLGLLNEVKNGLSLSQGMQTKPQIFPTLLRASVRSAETSGNLPEALDRYIQYAESIDLLKKKVISASIYPAIVLSFGFLVLAFLLIYVIPKFANIYQTQVAQISGTTEFVLALARFFDAYGKWIGILLALLFFAIFWALSQPNLRAAFKHWIWQQPYIGEKIRQYHLSRLYRTLSMLLRSGLTATHSLKQVEELVGSTLQTNLAHAQRLIQEGKPLSEAFEQAKLSTTVSLRLFRVGEKSGNLASMMERAAAFHESQLARWIDRFTKLFEPILMAAIGVIIGGIVLMMYLPIFELASGIE